MTEETPVSWRHVRAHLPVLASDGASVGTVVEVAAMDQEDIFHGIVFKHHTLSTHLLAPASQVERITETAVHLTCDAAAAARLAPFHELHVKQLGLRGLFGWRHLGWVTPKD